MDVTKLLKKGRGQGRGSSTGRGGRGRGRGRGFSSKSIGVVDVDDDDELCNMALVQAELENNSMTKSFEALNAATELDGFDSMSGSMWVYPTNRPVRDYQFDIVKTALFNNTLVSLPTGLGKTFISAVVMYNFQRWYPTGLVVFLAPTRPLVTQQLDACHNTVGISPAKTVELTGQIAPKKREMLWKTKTVFFLTPQVMLSDLERNFFLPEKVRCVVVDEAHKALGNHAYVQVIAKISKTNRLFRVLALSATPGGDLQAVQQVFKNLLISRVELRSDDSPDILPYIHEKKVEKRVVKLDPYLKSVHDHMMEVFQTYSGKLMKCNALTGRDGTSYSKFQLLKARETFRQNLATKIPSYQKGFIEVDFAVCISLAHAIEILLSHGLRTFYIFLHGVLSKEKGSAVVTSELRKSTLLQNLLDEIQQKLNISVENSTFDFDLSNTSGFFPTVGSPRHNAPNRSFIQEDVDFTLSHPKLKLLKDIVHKHFIENETKNATTRVMIFSQYRDSVQEIGNMLNSLRPLVKPMVFIGQANTSSVGRGLKQKDQVQVVQQFRDGGFNVLVATSVGEEGLDIGEVDLIICFDASKSPTRLIQRMGRTGRQREGRTVFLLTEGKEEKSYSASFSLHSSISKSITDRKKLDPFLYKQSPRMVPAGVDPTCYKLSVVLTTEQDVNPELMLVDPDNEENEPTKVLPGPTGKKTRKKQQPKKKADTAATTSRAGAEVSTNSIAKLFERMHKNASQTGPQEKEDKSAPAIVRHRPPPIPTIIRDGDGFCNEEGMDMHIEDDTIAFNTYSVYPKMFDFDRTDKTEWKPCTTFVKNKYPVASTVSASTVTQSLNILMLDDKALSAVEFAVKSRESFSYLKEDFCGCGNPIEFHDALVDHKQKQPAYYDSIKDPVPLSHQQEARYDNMKDPVPLNRQQEVCYDEIKDSVLLDQPFVEEEFDIPENFFDESSPEETEQQRNTNPTPPQMEVKAPKTPLKESSSEDEIRSEFSASPEIGQNRFLTRLNEIKSRKTPTSPRETSHPTAIQKIAIRREQSENVSKCNSNSNSKSTFASISHHFKKEKQNVECANSVLSAVKLPQDDIAIKMVSLASVSEPNKSFKKFKFKKKAASDDILNKEVYNAQPKACEPSTPPLSPILNLPCSNHQLHSPVNRKLFKASETTRFSPAFAQDNSDTVVANKGADVTTKTFEPQHSFIPSPSNPVVPCTSKPTHRNIKFLKSPSGNQGFVDNVIPDDIIEQAYRRKPPLKSSSTIMKSNQAVTKAFKFKKSSQKSNDDVNTENLEGKKISNISSSTATVNTPFEVESPKHSPIAGRKDMFGQNRPALKIVGTSFMNRSYNDTTTEAESPRPIVRSYPSPGIQSGTSPIISSSTNLLRSRDTANNNSVRQPTQHEFNPPHFIPSDSRSALKQNKLVPSPSAKNVLSRNRHKKKNFIPLPASSPTIITNKATAAAPVTPPRKPQLVLLDDDSPEILYKRIVSPTHTPSSVNSIRRNILGNSAAETPLSSRRNGPTFRSRASGAMSVSRSVTRSPISLPRSSQTSMQSSPRNVVADLSFMTADMSPYVIQQNQARRKPNVKRNPFIASQAVVSGDESEGSYEEGNEFEYEGLDDVDDSFVTNDDDTGVTGSQHAMYLESVKDTVPARFGRIEKPLSPKHYENQLDETGEAYIDDSFCQVDDDVDYMDVGVFTQAMNQAKVELAGSNSERLTRRGKREAVALQNLETNRAKQRRRIVMLNDSSDEDGDFK